MMRRDTLAHTKVLTKPLQMGTDHGEKAQNRLKKALHEDNSVVPNLVMNQ